MKPFFFIGNKRSGTTMVRNVLNQHPNIVCADECDIGWILYQISIGSGMDIHGHPYDTPYSMWLTSGFCHNEIWPVLFGNNRSLQHIFYDVVFRMSGKHYKKNVIWVGDKKPAQYADPYVNSFLSRFEDTHFIHMIRHPQQCVGSMLNLVSDYLIGPRHFYDIEQASTVWGIVEMWVIEAEKRAPTITIRYEDFLEDPRAELDRLETFFGISGLISPEIKVPQHYDLELHLTEDVRIAMERYDYN